MIEGAKLWQNRPLEEPYPIVYLDVLMVKVRDQGYGQNKAIYVVLRVNLEGHGIADQSRLRPTVPSGRTRA